MTNMCASRGITQGFVSLIVLAVQHRPDSTPPLPARNQYVVLHRNLCGVIGPCV